MTFYGSDARTAVDSEVQTILNSKNSNSSNSDYTKTMYERWHEANALIPLIDKKDILEDSPLFDENRNKGP